MKKISRSTIIAFKLNKGYQITPIILIVNLWCIFEKSLLNFKFAPVLGFNLFIIELPHSKSV